MVYGAVLAGGSGTRMNTSVPKQFLMLGGEPVIVHTLRAFVNSPKIDKVILAVPKEHIEKASEIIKKYLGSDIKIVSGGENRNESLMNVLAFIENNFGMDEETIVVTHDAVRPFVSERMIEENVESMSVYNACDTCIPATDTVIESLGGETVSAMPERQSLYQCQTPQTFKALKLKNLYNSLTAEEKKTLTDTGKIFFIRNEKVKIVMGDVSNLKITYPVDIALAEAILKERKK